jgi:hypothetical protein
MKPAAIKLAIRRDVEGWRGCLGLGEWSLALNFEPMGKRSGKHTVASCTAIWEQKDARLTFDVRRMQRKGLDRDEIRRTVLHELLHCVCNGYERFHEAPLLEEMVSALTVVVLRCWEAEGPV